MFTEAENNLISRQFDSSIRFYEQDDVATAKIWWEYWRKDAFNEGAFSNCGLVVLDNNKLPHALGFLYITNSARCFADYVIANPFISKQARNTAIDKLMDGLIGLASRKGYEVMEITVRNKKLLSRCKQKGFIDLGLVNYLGKNLCLAS
jgi:hypothetical protein